MLKNSDEDAFLTLLRGVRLVLCPILPMQRANTKACLIPLLMALFVPVIREQLKKMMSNVGAK